MILLIFSSKLILECRDFAGFLQFSYLLTSLPCPLNMCTHLRHMSLIQRSVIVQLTESLCTTLPNGWITKIISLDTKRPLDYSLFGQICVIDECVCVGHLNYQNVKLHYLDINTPLNYSILGQILLLYDRMLL